MTHDKQNLLASEKGEDPLGISLYGQPVGAAISPTLSERLKGNQQSLVRFMLESPRYGLDDLRLERNASLTREALR